MIIINQSFIQLLALAITTIKKNNYDFYIVYKEKPLFIFKFILPFLNFITQNRYYLKNIYFFRNQFYDLSTQEICLQIDSFHNRIFFKNERLGGQMFVENLLRNLSWEYYAFNEIFRYFYFEDKLQNHGEELEDIFNILNSIREKERKINNRITAIKGIFGFSLLLFRNIIYFKINKLSGNRVRKNFSNQSSFTIHNFEINRLHQNQDLIIKAIKFLSKDLKYNKLINEKDFLYYISTKIAEQKKVINFKKIIFLFLKLLFNFFTSKNFLKSCANFLDKLVSILLADINFPKEFKLLCIDPIRGKSLPIISQLKSQGFDISFSSFSNGYYYTKSFGMYNGPYKTIFSQSPGFTELIKQSGFKGNIKEIGCYLSLFNNSTIIFNKFHDENKSKIKIIVPDNQPLWFIDLSNREYEDFSRLLKELDSQKKIQISVKKKKKFSFIESYLKTNFPNNNILFKPGVRGYMGDFLDNDCILSLGLSSLGGKAAENFGLKYIIFDRSEKSQNQWKNFYAHSKLKPLFAKNIKDIERFLYEK